MLSIQEFTEAVSQYERRTLRIIAAIILLLIPYVALVMAFVDEIRRFFQLHFGGSTAEALIGATPFGPAAIALFVGLWLNDRRAKRDSRLYRPHCAKQLSSSRQLVVATRNCPHCGKRVLEEPI